MNWIFSRFYGYGWNGYFLDSMDMDEMDIFYILWILMKWIFSRFYGYGWNGYFLDSMDMDEMDIF